MNILILLAIAIIFASTALYSQFSVNAQSIEKEITEKTLHTVRNNTAGSSGLTDSSDSSPETTDLAEKTEDLSNITEIQ